MITVETIADTKPASPTESPADKSPSDDTALRLEVTDLKGSPVHLLKDPIERGMVILFTRTDCPVGNRYAPTISSLNESYSKEGIRFVLVYPDPSESADEIRDHLAAFDLRIDAVRDPNHILVAHCGASITPEAVVFDQKRQMIYRGRIDNRLAALGKERPKPTQHDLRDVLDAVTNNKTLSFRSTKAVGCIIEK